MVEVSTPPPLPRGWSCRHIGDVCTIFGRIGFRGYTVEDIVPEGQGAISLSPSNIQRSTLILEKCTFISWEKWEESPEIKIENGDILIVKTGSTVGKTALVKNLTEPATLNPQLVVLKKRRINETFLGYVAASENFQNQLASTAVGGALPTLSQKEIASYVFLCPNDPNEQQAIAAALSDADGVVAGLERVIAKKRLIKQGAMQDLLTARRRLPGFSGEWEAATLSELADIRSGGTPSTSDATLWDGDIAWVTPTDITALDGRKFLSGTTRTISRAGLRQSSAELLPEGTIVMTSRATIGECVISAIPLTTNQGFKNFIPKDRADRDFLYYLLMSQKKGFIELCSGSTFLEIGKTQLTGYTVRVPETKKEQEAIAAVLSDMDAEIQTLESRLAKARAVKEGMMQNLLTGRVRLV
ncbi:restriction endonuclease subunit S [Pseudogemmobacter blasticus]|uniref:Type I restriction modification DNA specificity domain-containing protein n=1 Tax=Fuscovulum blasticum DSM 2131 TaxID=1188250 RepID=A0A2T4J9M0_FUSBL|nr:restriction endonuclease subunit S [Fuscovulum blasticum]PTE14528.1 hypothetical protein C5F44_09125 [Fuscovulum blasticum DSM 2131]